MGIKEFAKELESGFKGTCYCISSKDEFLISDASVSIKGVLSLPDFCIDEFDLLDSDSMITVEALIDLLNMMPFMGGRRAVLVRHSEKFSKKDMARLEDYVSNPCPSSLLVLFIEMADSKKAPSFSFKGIREINLYLSQRNLRDWLDNKARQRGFRFSKDALDYLLEVAGDNPGILHSEALKFAALNKDTVDLKDISGLVYAGADYGVFELIGNIRRGDIKETIRGFHRLEDTVEPYQIIGALCWDYVMKQPKTKEYLIDTLKILHESDLLIKRAALCSVEMTILKMLKVIR